MQTELGARWNYANAKQVLIDSGLDANSVANAALTQSFIRLEILLTATSTQFKFPVLVNDTTAGVPVRPTEQRLNLQDAFYCAEAMVYIAKASSATDSTLIPVTYPSPVTFPTGAAGLGSFYNGKLNIAVNNVTIVPAWPILKFRNVPQTQLTAATNSPIDEFHGFKLAIVQPNVVLIGQKNNVITITLPQAIGTIDTFTYAIIELEGYLAQNVTVVS